MMPNQASDSRHPYEPDQGPGHDTNGAMLLEHQGQMRWYECILYFTPVTYFSLLSPPYRYEISGHTPGICLLLRERAHPRSQRLRWAEMTWLLRDQGMKHDRQASFCRALQIVYPTYVNARSLTPLLCRRAPD